MEKSRTAHGAVRNRIHFLCGLTCNNGKVCAAFNNIGNDVCISDTACIIPFAVFTHGNAEKRLACRCIFTHGECGCKQQAFIEIQCFKRQTGVLDKSIAACIPDAEPVSCWSL